MARHRRTVALRTSLLRSFALLILLSTCIVLVLTWLRALETERRLSDRLLRRGSDEARRELDRFLHPAAAGTEMGMAWGQAGLLRLDGVTGGSAGEALPTQLAEARRLNGLLLPYLLAHPALSSVQIANERGEGFLVLQRDEEHLVNRVVRPGTWGRQALWIDIDRDGVPTHWTWEAIDYEPRGRAWYRMALDAPPGAVRWTDAYAFATTKDLGITAAGRWSDEGLVHVLAYDVLLNDLSAFTGTEAGQVSPNALALVTTADGRVLGVPPLGDGDEATRRARYLAPLDQLGPAVFADAAQALGAGGAAAPRVTSFASGGDTWWAGLRAYPLGPDQQLHIVVLVPNTDLLEEVTEQRRFLLLATGLALLAAFVYSMVLSRAYGRPLEALALQSRRIRDLDFSADEPIEARLHEFEELAQAQQQSMAALQSFSRYVPLDVVRQLVADGEVARIGGREETLTILFTDIAGFTAIAEAMTPQDLADHMATYFQALLDVLQDHGATVDKLVGDAIVAFWGAPRPLPDHAERGVRAALACREVLETLAPRWSAAGRPALPTRFGLSTGPVVVGNLGATSRLAYTALGDRMNLASRLEGLNKVYGTEVLVDDATRRTTGETFAWRRVDRAVVVGRSAPLFLHEPLGEAASVDVGRRALARRYEEAWDAYAARRFEEALARLEEVLAAAPDDGPAAWLRDRVQACLGVPPPPAWDATTWHTAK